jgi:autotransporter-associated beta strand protein
MLSMPNGGTFSMADGATQTLHLQQQSGTTDPPLALNVATLDFDLSSSASDRITDVGAAQVSGVNTINVTALGSSLTAGSTYTLISAGSGLTGKFRFANSAAVELMTSGGHSYALVLGNSDTAETLKVVNTDYWIGTPTNHNWDTSTANWSSTSGGQASKAFANGDAVVFDNSANAASFNVSATSPVSPAAIIFNNTTAYSLTDGDSAPVNTTAMALAAGGSVTLVGESMTSVTTSIGAGTLTLGNGATNGTVGGEIVDNAALAFNNPSEQTVLGDISGTGTVGTTSGDGLLTFSGATTYSGQTTIAANSTLTPGVPDAFSPNSCYAVAGALDLGGFDQSIGSLSGAGVVTNSANSTSAMLTIGHDGTSTSFSGSMQDTIADGGVLALDKIGSGALTLTGRNTFSGETTVDGGTLEVDNYIMQSAVTINPGAALQGNGGTGLVSVNDGGHYAANVYNISFDDGTLQRAAGSLTVAGSISLADAQDGFVWGLSPADAIFKEINGSASVEETNQTYVVQGWGNIVNGLMAAPAFTFNPTFSYADGVGTHSIGQAIVFDEHDGFAGAGSYNADFVALAAVQISAVTRTVTNMKPLRFNAQDAGLPSGFVPVITAMSNVRGGSISDNNDGTWTFTPNSTRDTAPWDPLHPFGGGAGDGLGGGASFTVTFTDAQNAQAVTTVVLRPAHLGYYYTHRGPMVNANMPSEGGTMLVGGGAHPYGAYQWFVDRTGHGDIVAIAATSNMDADLESDGALADEFMSHGARSVDIFDFEVDGFGDFNEDSWLVVQNTLGFGTEFMDRLGGAEGLYFAGGDQYPYSQLLLFDQPATQLINNSCNFPGSMVIGGTSAGMAALGEFAYTAAYTRDGSPELTSANVLNNMHTHNFYQNGQYAISEWGLHLDSLYDTITETHFNDKDRLGRFFCFLGATLLSGYTLGHFDLTDTALGIAADSGSALTIDSDGTCNVFGRTIYFGEAFADDFSRLGLTQPDINDPSKVRLRLYGIELGWYQGSYDGPFSIYDVFDTTRNQNAEFSVEDGTITWVSGSLPPDFQRGKDYV